MEQQLVTLPEVEPFWVLRGGGSVKIEPCPDGSDAWHWTFIPTEPNMATVMTGMATVGPTGEIVPETREVEVPPEQHHLTTDAVLNNLSLEESRLFLGWCSHLHEHVNAHLGTCISTLQQAWEERRFSGVEKLATEVLVAERVRGLVSQAMRQTYFMT